MTSARDDLCCYVGWLARVGCPESEGRRAVLYRVRRVAPRTKPMGRFCFYVGWFPCFPFPLVGLFH